MADDINIVAVVGRLTRDAELKYTNSELAVCKFSLAVNRRKKSGDQWVDEVSYFDMVLWGKLGEAIQQHMTKGKQLAVSGHLNQNRWEQDGQNRSKVEIVVDNVQLLGSAAAGSGGSNAGASSGGGGMFGGPPNDSNSGGSQQGMPDF